MNRHIIHLNVADFAVAVERTVDRRLRDRPVIVAPDGGSRALVYDMSQEAYVAGVRKQMPLSAAVRRCSDARILPPHPDRYHRAMRAMVKKALPFSPRVEPGEADGHLFLDVTGTHRLFGPPVDVAWRLCDRLKTDLGLRPIWSVAPNKLVAKVATRLVKPCGEYIVSDGEQEALLFPLPIHLIPGIERGDRTRLREFNLTRAGHVAALLPSQMETLFGTRARRIGQAVRGIDTSPVLPAGRQPPRIAIDHRFASDTTDPAIARAVLYALVELAGRQLRRRNLAARRIVLCLVHSDGVHRIRQAAARPATASDTVLFDLARQALEWAWTRRVRIRRIRLICDRLTFPPAQMPLFAESRRETRKVAALESAIDRIRDRFGPDAVRRGRTLVIGL